MTGKVFGQFLLERGAIGREAFLDALQHQAEIRLPLCAMILERGILNESQLAELDAEHAKTKRKVLEIAVRRRILTFQQLEELSLQPAQRWHFQTEALIQRGWAELTPLHQLLQEHRQLYPGVQAPELDVLFANVPERDLVLPFVRASLDLLLRYTRQVMKVVAINEPASSQGLTYAFCQKVKGDRDLHYALVLPEELVHPIASHILEVDGQRLKISVLDAVLEFANVVVGNACATLSAQGVKLRGEPPQLLTIEDLDKESPGEGVTATVESAKGKFHVMIRFPDPSMS